MINLFARKMLSMFLCLALRDRETSRSSDSVNQQALFVACFLHLNAIIMYNSLLK